MFYCIEQKEFNLKYTKEVSFLSEQHCPPGIYVICRWYLYKPKKGRQRKNWPVPTTPNVLHSFLGLNPTTSGLYQSSEQ